MVKSELDGFASIRTDESLGTISLLPDACVAKIVKEVLLTSKEFS